MNTSTLHTSNHVGHQLPKVQKLIVQFVRDNPNCTLKEIKVGVGRPVKAQAMSDLKANLRGYKYSMRLEIEKVTGRLFKYSIVDA